MSPLNLTQQSLQDGNKRISCNVIGSVDGWIDKQELPVGPALKVEKPNEPWYGMSEDEVEDRREFIRCYINKDFEVLLQIPVEQLDNDFWFSSRQEFMESPFNTYDFQKGRRPFNRYAYRIRKVLEQVKELALLHSCISQPQGRTNVQRRYEDLVENEFRGRLLFHAKKYQYTYDDEGRFQVKRKIQELNRRILECKIIWEKYSPWER